MQPALELTERFHQVEPGVFRPSTPMPQGADVSIRVTTDQVEVRTDLLRSIPLYFGERSGKLVITDDPHRLVSDESSLDAQGLADFRFFGYGAADRTLFSGVKVMRAASVYTFRADASQPHIVADSSLIFASGEHSNPLDHTEAFAEAFDAEMRRLVSIAKGRQLAIPLSGGLDSRLLATWLSKHEYANIVAFTYGREGTREAAISRNVAKSLGIAWHFVDYTSEAAKKRWLSPQTFEWMRYASGAASLPHMQDFVALGELLDRGVLSPDSIVLPGHTAVGNMHDAAMAQEEFTSNARAALAIENNHSLRLDNSPAPRGTHEAVLHHLECVGFDGSPSSLIDAFISFNLMERQPKYINQSMRTYEFYGLDWAIPMLEPRFIRAWNSGSHHLVADRVAYKNWISKEYSEQSGEAFTPYFAPARSKKSTRDRVRQVLRLLRIETPIERALTARASLNSGVALDHFVTAIPRHQVAARIMCGSTLMGLFSEQFIADTWNPHAALFSSRNIDTTREPLLPFTCEDLS